MSGLPKMAAASAVRTRQPPLSADMGRAMSSSEKPRLTRSCCAREAHVSDSMRLSCSSTSCCLAPSKEVVDVFEHRSPPLDARSALSALSKVAASASSSRRSTSALTTISTGVMARLSSVRLTSWCT